MPISISIPGKGGSRVMALLLILFAITLPFDRFYSQLLLISLVAHTAIQMRRDQWRAVSVKTLLPYWTVFILTVLTTPYSTFIAEALSFWERQIAIILIPLMLMLQPVDPKLKPMLLRCFIAVNVLVVALLYIDAFRVLYYYGRPVSEILSPALLSHGFSAPLELHATYLSLFLALSLAAAITELLSKKHRRIAQLILAACIALLAAGLLQLASRAVLASTVVFLVSIIPAGLRWKRARTYLLSVAAVFIAMAVILSVSTTLRQRLLTEFRSDLGTVRTAGRTDDPRGRRWQIATQLIARSPLYGYGTGAEVPLLRDEYFRQGLYDAYLNKLNAHNQYLAFAIRGGLPALLAYLASIGWFAARAWRERNVQALCFLALIAGTCMSENLLDLNKGIFFFAFFLPVLLPPVKKRRKESSVSNPARVQIVHTKQPVIPENH